MTDIGRTTLICEVVKGFPWAGVRDCIGGGCPSLAGGASVGESIASGIDVSGSVKSSSGLMVFFGQFQGNDYFPGETVSLSR
ncbi:hypothetical protein AA14337_3257 [Acetobacter malorum DSM 14337]|uniref:Uncharacterized protein n=1 Tax=Acetobacter malorum DSM 14337 TaxID=1307910 RepID=A0ABQ0Q0K0_9PROT|nr:hypothetical protein AA14337_3257 [Acetobacter malorum DSM 14337]